MANIIQIAPLQKDFQRIIDFDRKYPATKIIVFVTKCDTQKGTANYKSIEQCLKKLREYCQLAKIQFNMQVIDTYSKETLMEVILDFARAFILEYTPEHSYLLNLGENSLLLNISLLQAAQIVQSIFNKDIQIFIKERCSDQEILFHKKIYRSFDRLVSEPVSLDLLNCVYDGQNLDGIKTTLNISLGTASNHLKHLKDLELIAVNGHSRNLTELGTLVRKILQLIQK